MFDNVVVIFENKVREPFFFREKEGSRALQTKTISLSDQNLADFDP